MVGTIVISPIFCSYASKADEQGDLHRSLEMELEQVPGSTGYEVEVTRLLADGKKKPPMTFKLETTVWKATLLPGHYEMRVRSFDERHVPGDWTTPLDFIVKLFPPQIISPKDKEEIVSQDDQKEKVKLEWSAVNRATKYIVTVLDQKGNKVLEETASDPTITVKIPVASEYTWHVLPTTDDGTQADPSVDAHFKIIGKKLDSPSISKIPEEDTKLITWKPVEFAQTYNVILEFKTKTGEYKELLNKKLISPHLQFDTPLKTGKYRFKVRAQSANRLDSDFSTAEFDSFSAQDEQLHRASYQTKFPLFVKLGGGTTGFNYTNQSMDFNSTTSFPTQGVTGIFSVGTWFREKSKWGMVATVETEVVPNLNQNNAYNTIGLQAVRRFNFGTSSQIRVYLGALMNQVPDVVSDQEHNFYQRISTTYGPSLQLAYYVGLTDNWALKFSAQMSPTLGGQTPDGGNLRTKIDGELNFALLRNISEHFIAGLEYYNRNQQVTYWSSTANNGFSGSPGMTPNSLELDSQTLMLTLEFGF